MKRVLEERSCPQKVALGMAGSQIFNLLYSQRGGEYTDTSTTHRGPSAVARVKQHPSNTVAATSASSTWGSLFVHKSQKSQNFRLLSFRMGCIYLRLPCPMACWPPTNSDKYLAATSCAHTSLCFSSGASSGRARK